ncbi:transcriptional regulator [Allokutzneria sp. NRRL B-24872]|uniref:transcriptional regulator n=1 Tax=Allokutzneria sp. NRRL B-24872 TaxID=1137961 RepID=UPI001FEE7F29|nr:transcriptional regulator [Allokutzneria sp. NRRL B-24872]
MPFSNAPKGDLSRQLADSEAISGGSAGQRMKVEKSAIPTMRKAFQRALDRLTPEVGQARSDLRIRPWAGDPVSAEAAERFNDRSVDSGEAALGALEGYQQQLNNAVSALEQIERGYRRMESGNRDLMDGKQSGC